MTIEYTEKDILYETPSETFFVIKQKRQSRRGAFEVLLTMENASTHAIVRGTYDCKVSNALQRATDRADELEKLLKT